MALSPDECKWSERSTTTQQGMRCGFTGTRVHERVLVRYDGELELWPRLPPTGHPTGRHTDLPRERMSVYFRVLLLKCTENIFGLYLDCVLHLNFSWVITCMVNESQVVPFVSQAHSTACHFIATIAVCAEEPARSLSFSRYSHMVSQACIINTHTCRPTNSPLFKWNISLADGECLKGTQLVLRNWFMDPLAC